MDAASARQLRHNRWGWFDAREDFSHLQLPDE